MVHVKTLILFLTITCVLFLMIGLIKPWAMLWWEDVQNRGKVVKVYGSLAIVFGVTYWVLTNFL